MEPGLQKLAGDEQTGITGQALADSLEVVVADSAGQPLTGIRVAWEVVSGGGNISPDASLTDTNGRALAQWTTGQGAGEARATAEIAPSSTDFETFRSTGLEEGSLRLTYSVGGWRFTEGVTDREVFLPSDVELRGIMILVDFEEAPAPMSPSAAYQQLIPAAQQWFAETSRGKSTLSVEVPDRWHRSPRPAAEYELGWWLPLEPLQIADHDVDFSRYDFVIVVTSVNSPTGAIPLPSGSGFRTADGEVRHVILLGKYNLQYARGPTVLVHEMGHLLGMPDLYYYASLGGVNAPSPPDINGFVGAWDVMGSGQSLLGWHHYKLGWLPRSEVLGLGWGGVEIVLAPPEATSGIHAVVVPISGWKAYVLEVRTLFGDDGGVCDGGVLIYTVDASTPSGAGPVRILPSRNRPSNDVETFNRCGPLYYAPFDLEPGEVSTFEDPLLSVRVLAEEPGGGYRVRVMKR